MRSRGSIWDILSVLAQCAGSMWLSQELRILAGLESPCTRSSTASRLFQEAVARLRIWGNVVVMMWAMQCTVLGQCMPAYCMVAHGAEIMREENGRGMQIAESS